MLRPLDPSYSCVRSYFWSSGYRALTSSSPSTYSQDPPKKQWRTPKFIVGAAAAAALVGVAVTVKLAQRKKKDLAFKYVIVGTGPAACSAIDEIRIHDPRSEVIAMVFKASNMKILIIGDDTGSEILRNAALSVPYNDKRITWWKDCTVTVTTISTCASFTKHRNSIAMGSMLKLILAKE